MLLTSAPHFLKASPSAVQAADGENPEDLSAPPTELEAPGEIPGEEMVEGVVAEAGPYLGLILGLGIAVGVALAITVVSSMVMKQVFRRSPDVKRAINRTRLPLFLAITLLGTRITLGYAASDEAWFGVVAFSLFVAVVVMVAWWALRVVGVIEAVIMSRYMGDGDIEDRRGRRLQTQVSLIRRILAAVIITFAVAAILLMVPQVRALGAGLLASAGVVSVVAGLAMQSTLTNVFAGIQLAFTDSIRVGDVVSVEDNFGVVEDITLSAVVLKVWDERRVIYPSSYFVATPFENWTRVGTEMLGTVELEVDWRVPMDELRARVKRLVNSTELWDGRECSMQVTDALGGIVKCRAVVSARNSGELWDLRCLIREDFVNFLRAEHPYAVVTQRMLVSHEDALAGGPQSVSTGQFQLFGEPAGESIGGESSEGTPEQSGFQERSRQAPITGPVPVRQGSNAASQEKTEEPDDERSAADAAPAGAGKEEQEFLQRYGSVTEPGAGTGETPLTTAGEGASMFTGSISAVERNREFSGPGEDAYRERRERQVESVEGLSREELEEEAAAETETDPTEGRNPAEEDEPQGR